MTDEDQAGHVSVQEVRRHLAALLKRVERGETIVITRHGKPIAKLAPADPKPMTKAEAIAAIREFRKGHTLDGISIKELINEGRRY